MVQGGWRRIPMCFTAAGRAPQSPPRTAPRPALSGRMWAVALAGHRRC